MKTEEILLVDLCVSAKKGQRLNAQLVYKLYTKICMILFVIYNVFKQNMILITFYTCTEMLQYL